MMRIQIGVSAAALALAVWLLPEFYITILNYVGLYGLVALGIVLLTGVIGVTSFGQAAFVGSDLHAQLGQYGIEEIHGPGEQAALSIDGDGLVAQGHQGGKHTDTQSTFATVHFARIGIDTLAGDL